MCVGGGGGVTSLPSFSAVLGTPCIKLKGKSAIAAAGEFELMFTNTEVHKIVRISKTDQDNPDL